VPNHLTAAASAYLRSASHQPIDWYAWGPAAFSAAEAGRRPILLDIGAVWCHWCHVMDGESYEDPELAAFLNQHFVCIKVDRDERPDVDARYQRAIQAMTGQGGWPLTAFLLPDGQAFFGGTYFPPDGKYGRPGFRAVLEQVLDAFRTQPDRVEQQAVAVRRVVSARLDEATQGAVGPALLARASDHMTRLFDRRYGGFGTQPKFPHPGGILFLLSRLQATGDPTFREVVERTLLGMSRGGIHDQIGGGFHRYSVDARWIVPHFEKMSYDNAELLRAYAEAAAALDNEECRDTARGIVRFIREVLADPEGGYGASQDADVGLHDDGDYFTWTPDEAAAALTAEEYALASAYYDIGTAGEMDHNPSKNVLFVAEPLDRIATRLGLDEGEAVRRLAAARVKLKAARDRREAPFIDRTRYNGWTAMLAGALIRAAPVLDEPWALEHGLKSLAWIRREAADPAALLHSPGGVGGLLDDQVQTAHAALEAFEATGDETWLDWSIGLLGRVWRDYHDEAGGLFDTSTTAGEGLLPTRLKPVEDAPTPSPNGLAALCAARLHELTGQAVWRERRDALLTTFAGRAAEAGLYAATLLAAADWAMNPATHLVIVDGPDQELAERLHRHALRAGLPRRVVHRVRSGAPTGRLPPAVQGMMGARTGTRAYACIGSSCRSPASTEEEWLAVLGA
jgi:uncharacterized protein